MAKCFGNRLAEHFSTRMKTLVYSGWTPPHPPQKFLPRDHLIVLFHRKVTKESFKKCRTLHRRMSKASICIRIKKVGQMRKAIQGDLKNLLPKAACGKLQISQLKRPVWSRHKARESNLCQCQHLKNCGIFQIYLWLPPTPTQIFHPVIQFLSLRKKAKVAVQRWPTSPLTMAALT